MVYVARWCSIIMCSIVRLQMSLRELNIAFASHRKTPARMHASAFICLSFFHKVYTLRITNANLTVA